MKQLLSVLTLSCFSFFAYSQITFNAYDLGGNTLPLDATDVLATAGEAQMNQTAVSNAEALAMMGFNTGYYWTGCSFEVPGSYIPVTKNWRMVVNARIDPSNPIYSYDFSISANSGLPNEMLIGMLGDGVDFRPEFTSIKIGNLRYTGTGGAAIYPGAIEALGGALVLPMATRNAYTDYEITFNNGEVDFLVNGASIVPLAVKPLNFSTDVCQIEKYAIGFKGTGDINYVRIYNDLNTLVYEEEFDDATYTSTPAPSDPNITITGGGTYYTGSSTTLNASSDGTPVSFTWLDPSSNVVSTSSSYTIPAVNGSTQGTYQVIVRDQHYCDVTQSVSVSESPFPIHLLSFDGHNEKGRNTLMWTYTDVDAGSFFELERSENTQSFQKIATLSADKGLYAAGVYSYHFEDENAPKTAFYRLKIVNIDGQISYSEMVELSQSEALATVLIAPNPTSQILGLELMGLEKGDVEITLFNPLGQIAFSTKEIVSSQIASIKQDVSELSRGLYILKISSEGKEICNTMVEIQ